MSWKCTVAGVARGRVDGVFVVDLRCQRTPRPGALVQLGLPAVILAGSLPFHSLPTVWQNEAEVEVSAVRYWPRSGTGVLAVWVAGAGLSSRPRSAMRRTWQRFRSLALSR